MAVLALVPLVQVVKLQVDGRDLSEQGLGQRLRSRELPAERGSILDRNGAELAISVPRSRVAVNKALLTEEGVDDPGSVEEFATRLARWLDVPADRVRDALLEAAPDDPWVKVAETVDPERAKSALEKAERAGTGGVLVLEPSTERLHPAGDSALRVIGTVGPDGPGPRAGIEKAFDRHLRGRPGRVVVEKDPQGVTITGGEHVTEAAVPGSDVQLTLDRTLQYETERILTRGTANARAAGGIAIVGRPATGELLAVAAVEKDPETGEVVLSSSPSAFSNAYQAGSVFKLVTVAAAYESGVIDDASTFVVDDQITVADRTFSDHEPHAAEQMTVDQIVARSSNVGTIQIGQRVGSKALHDELVDFGFGRLTGVGHPAESAGLLPDVEKWSTPDLAAASIGTFQSTTPVQLWAAYNVIANDGRYVAPRLVDATVAPDGTRTPVPARPSRQVISEETAGRVERALRAVISEGTGKQWDLPGYPVAAKTGTGRMPSPERVAGDDDYVWKDGRYHYVTAFTGYLPADRPQVSITVVLTDTAPGLTGGTSAGPIFADLARLAIRELTIAPTDVSAAAGSSQRPVRAAPAAEGTAATDRPLLGSTSSSGTSSSRGSTRGAAPSTTIGAGAATGSSRGASTTTATGATGAGPRYDDR